MHTFLVTMTLLAVANTAACDATDSQTTPATANHVTVTCGKNLGIDASAASRKDWGGTSEWTAAAQGDSLVLTRTGACGDECNYTEKIILASITDDCPKLLSASVTRVERGEPTPQPRVTEAVEGTLEIQDWNPAGGIVSGRIHSEVTLVFYVKTVAPPAEP